MELPEIGLGWDGINVVKILFVRIGPDPHELFALTVIFPLLLPAVVLIILEEELPLQPLGNVHV